MSYLATAVALVAFVSLLNVVLSFGMVRRLRQHSELLSTYRATSTSSRARMLDVGESPEDFVATTTDGEVVTRDDLEAGSIVAFLSPACDDCEREVPEFMTYADRWPGGRSRVLAVLLVPGGEADEMAQRLRSVARVVVEEASGGPVTDAFRTIGVPAYGVLDGGVVRTVVSRVAHLPPQPLPVGS